MVAQRGRERKEEKKKFVDDGVHFVQFPHAIFFSLERRRRVGGGVEEGGNESDRDVHRERRRRRKAAAHSPQWSTEQTQ